MFDFFNGWRRKLGVVALGLAAAFTSAWMRSLSVFDVVYIPVSNTATIGIVSAAGEIDLFRFWELEAQHNFFFTTGDLQSTYGCVLDETGNIAAWSKQHTIDWRFDCAGLRLGTSRLGERCDFDCVLPYWSITLSMSLFAAYLILWKPRKKSSPD